MFTVVLAGIGIGALGLTYCANRTSREALIAVQRAFVFVDGFRGDKRLNANGAVDAVELSVMWKNSGTTPTRSLRGHSNVSWPDEAMPADFDFADIPSGHPEGPLLLGPQASTLGDPIAIPAARLTQLQQGQGHIYFWGWMRYRDVFEKTKPHISMYCYEMIWVAGNIGAPPPEGLNLHARMCDRHNCSDDDCRPEPGFKE